MESGAGKHWTEEEVKALLSIWSEKNIRKQLYGTLRNKGIFIYIAKRLQEKGIFRGWKQCRAKYKNLKYEYRTVKYAHNSGDVSKTMKFFHELDVILQYEPVSQLTEDEDSRYLATETQLDINTAPGNTKGEIPVALEDDEDISRDPLLFISHIRPMELGKPTSILDSSNNPTFIPSVANEGGKHWTINEVRALIGIWSEKNIQKQLEGTMRNKRIFEQIAARLQKFGIDRDWKQCRTKYKNLKHEYKIVKNSQDLGTTKSMKFFAELDAILGHTTEQSQKLENEGRQRPIKQTDIKMEKDNMVISEDVVEGSISNISEDLGETAVKENHHTVQDPDKEVVTVEDPKVLHIKRESLDMDEDSLSTASEDLGGPVETDEVNGPDNYIPLEDAHNHLKIITVSDAEAGKHWCDNEVRALIHIWSDEKIRQMLEGATRNKEIFKEIARRLLQFGIDRDWKQCRTKYKNLKYEYRVLQKKTNNLGSNPGRKMRFYEEIDCILRQQNLGKHSWKNSSSLISESGEGHVMTARSLNKRKAYENELVPLPLKRSASDTTMHQFHQSITEQKNSTDNLCRQETKQVSLPQSANQVSSVLTLSAASRCTAKEMATAEGIKTAFTKKCGETAFIAPQCEMIPIEWVCRRIATGSFLKRNPGVKEGYKFYPPKVELFFKDDANNDPQWSEEQLIAAKWCFAGLSIGQTEVDIMSHSTQAIFEILEKSWLPQNCTLVDMKIEFGVDVTTKEIVLADVIDNDSWRLWPSGDRAQQKDKQSYRDLKEVTPEGLQMVKRNFEWVAERVELLQKVESSCRVVVLMGSTSDLGHCEKIKKACGNYGIPCELRVTSAHKGPDETLKIKAEYEGDGVPTVFVAVAGRSNGLGPVMSGNTAYPVVNCPPLTPDWGAQDVWSSLRMPSGLGCSTILSPEGAAQFAAQIFGLNNHLVWAKLRGSILNTWVSLKQADKKIRECSL
ncbi:bifunctional phosphoribosylaminoimidazole carboxylase/phosphoribosylaminoimidazole succinocarboxamide synthetase isoform X2 [Monodelphis domestica]|uniref:bifunctional phosphoribosylaminoimidazole carboxylase/phosphoribosylaminoimidazole succinocarboxamide synthetase isoform X2 n=1 Tax=Monodelphis domestica TaxID=13616 RepID=UPI0024E19B6F|nr:bifunctional phosphoribosylaminoimidazole carboxylase/phosphoribosylaminoimidazole succinocarboxamide synthetase isoform X2 [Monodelphis domestica]